MPFLIDSTAASGVNDDPTTEAPRFGDTETDDVEVSGVAYLADDRRSLRCADIESDEIAAFGCHAPPAGRRKPAWKCTGITRYFFTAVLKDDLLTLKPLSSA